MFSHLPQLNSIRVFDSAARHRSFKLASIELNVTATAVSHQIRTLEKQLGTLLFERKTRSISLTPEGKLLAQAANHSLHQISNAINEISNKNTVLSVSTTASFANQWLAPRLESFHQHCSDIQIVIKTGEHLDNLLKDHRVDVAIRYGENNNEEALKLITEHFGMYATKEYLQTHRKLKKSVLIETTWKNTNLRPILWEQFLNYKNLKVRTFDQEQHAIQAALAGQGVALVSSLLVKNALDHGWLEKHPNSQTITGLTYYLLTSEHQKNSPKVRIFRHWLLEELKKDTLME